MELLIAMTTLTTAIINLTTAIITIKMATKLRD